MTLTFEEARAAASAADPNEQLAPYGFQGETEWIVPTLPTAVGVWCAYVDQETGAVRWESEVDEAYTEETPVGDWTGVDEPEGVTASGEPDDPFPGG